jgi:hypothetical protein
MIYFTIRVKRPRISRIPVKDAKTNRERFFGPGKTGLRMGMPGVFPKVLAV